MRIGYLQLSWLLTYRVLAAFLASDVTGSRSTVVVDGVVTSVLISSFALLCADRT